MQQPAYIPLTQSNPPIHRRVYCNIPELMVLIGGGRYFIATNHVIKYIYDVVYITTIHETPTWYYRWRNRQNNIDVISMASYYV